MIGLHGKHVHNLFASASYDSNGDLVVTPAMLGIPPSSIVVRARLLIEITSNASGDTTNIVYFGPIFLDDDGSNITPGNSEFTVMSISSGQTANESAPIFEANASMSPLTANGGMRLRITNSTWAGALVAAFHITFLYVN